MSTHTATLLLDKWPEHRGIAALFEVVPPYKGITYLHIHYINGDSGLRLCHRSALHMLSLPLAQTDANACLVELGEQIATQWEPLARLWRKP